MCFPPREKREQKKKFPLSLSLLFGGREMLCCVVCVSELGGRKRGRRRRRRRDHDQQAWEEEREGAIWRRGVGGGGGRCFSLSLSVGGRGKQLHKKPPGGKKSTFFLSYTAWYNMGKHCFETISAKECLSLFEVSMKLSLHSRARRRPPQKQCPPLHSC